MISLEKPQRKWASSRLEGKTSWIFSSCGRCSRLTTATSGTRSGGLRKGQSPFEMHGGLSEFLSPFLWRAPPLEMRRERREFFLYKTGKGSLISSSEAETGLPWMCSGPSCFLSSGDGCVGRGNSKRVLIQLNDYGMKIILDSFTLLC